MSESFGELCSVNNLNNNRNFKVSNNGQLNQFLINTEYISERSRLRMKESFLTMLEDGFNINGEKSYNSIKKLLANFFSINLCDYKDIKKSYLNLGADHIDFSLTLDSSTGIVYLYPPSDFKGTTFTSSFGYIENSKFYDDFSLEFDNPTNNNILPVIPKELCDFQTELKPKVEPKPKVESKPEVDFPYIVVSGDTLWKIIKNKYGLVSNRDIANAINKLVKYNIDNGGKESLNIDKEGDNIKGDKIYVGDKILIPKELKFRNQVFTRV